MNGNGESTALAVINEYPPERYNVLIPVKTLQEISPIHKVIINEVQIDPDPNNGKDVYAEKNGELALTKKGLAKLMAGANIQVINSESIPPTACKRCMEIAQRTRLAPRCGDCPSKDDVAHQIVIAVPEPSGTWRMVRGTKELRMEDERAKMTEKQFKQFFPYRTEHCETKALNRALREGLMVQSTYKREQLQKPFAVALVVPNMADPEMRKAVAARMAQSSSALFGSPALEASTVPDDQTKALPDGSQVDVSTGEIVDAGPDTEIFSDNDAPTTLAEDPPTLDFETDDDTLQSQDPLIPCEGDNCGGVIEKVRDSQGRVKTAEEFAEWTKRQVGRRLCYGCFLKEIKARQQRGA